MGAQSYRLRSSVTCFVLSSSGETEPLTIPAGSVVILKSVPADGVGLAAIRWGDITALTLIGHFLDLSDPIDTSE